ncbi:cadherin EGF LAG seven-pass G-type receptor 2 [Pelobates cultripes]|uniref:Cadherin EGF LAG seven-pass G-type receptor 2 n=1 Tax=Pelobates cultripes TaxID=61616 RepID=A0AAD1R165_PELCU|nr:cadherin EGF LAG seven-pass G-type receptor 2 [Pelobates cultripes]
MTVASDPCSVPQEGIAWLTTPGLFFLLLLAHCPSNPTLQFSWTCIDPLPQNIPSILSISSQVSAHVPSCPHEHLHIITTLHLRSAPYGEPNKLCLNPGLTLLPLPSVQPAPWGKCQFQCQTVGSPGATVWHNILVTTRHLCLTHQHPLEMKLQCQPCTKQGEHIVHWKVMLPQLVKQKVKGLAMLRGKRNVNTSPQFQTPSYQVSVPENKPAGTFVVQLRASDPDEGAAGRLEYSMDALFDSRSASFFSLDPNSGEVTTADELDRETKSTHVFRVTVSDAGVPRRTAMATLTVSVSDTNDHDPTFEQPEYRESVRENMEVGYEVMTVRATDGDSVINANIAYRLVSGAGEAFEIDHRSGVIRTRGPVDRESVAFYELLVEADDQGREPGPRSSTATVHISVEDENDNAPQFTEKRYVAHVAEDIYTDSQLLVVTATDLEMLVVFSPLIHRLVRYFLLAHLILRQGESTH